MLPRKNRLGTWFFTVRRSPDTSFDSPSFTLRVYKTKERILQVAVVVSKKVEKTAVSRNNIKRKTFGFFEKYKQQLQPRAYVLYIKKGATISKIKIEMEKVLKKFFLDKSPDVV